MSVLPLVTPAGALDSAGRLVAAEAPSDPFSDTAAANTAVVRTFAAVPGQIHRLTALAWSYSAAPTGGRILVQDGAATRLDLDITAGGQAPDAMPPGGIQGTVNTAMTVTLAAAGVGIVGKLFTAKITS